MSEIRLNLIDEQQILYGTIHGSVADSAVAALSAEPETIPELETALTRFIKPISPSGLFASFETTKEINEAPWDAGIVIIDLASRIVAVESTYSFPAPSGEVAYHDGTKSTELTLSYRTPEDWIFINSIAEYAALQEPRRNARAANQPLDAREVLYGRQMLEWIVTEVREDATLWHLLARRRFQSDDADYSADSLVRSDNITTDCDANPISSLHARWLMTPRENLRGQSPRDILFAKRDFIDFDLNSREMQWSFLNEGPPCLSTDSLAYRFAGFGTHEWVIYYDLVRHLLWSAATSQRFVIDMESKANPSRDIEVAVRELDEMKNAWLEQTNSEYGRTPAVLIDNERKRLPIAMSPREMIVDEDCPTCQMLANDPELSLGVGFWHLDGCNMDDDFVFSHHSTREEFEAERLEWQAFSEKFNREWEDKQQAAVRGEQIEFEPCIGDQDRLDSVVLDTDSSDFDETSGRKRWGPRGWGAA